MTKEEAIKVLKTIDFKKNSLFQKKSTWQKIYSAFGFWSYYEYVGEQKYRTFYWCSLPRFKFYRKFDLLKYKVKD